jgi:two-component system phosphate regulon sensor histidine kinase PhoR
MDPSARRARNVVLLVVLTVALPSLLLTGLAAVAVSNEEAAAERRFKAQFAPVADALGLRFNEQMDRLIRAADDLLPRLVASGQSEEDEPAPGLAPESIASVAVNPFVLDSDGEVLVPRRPAHGEDPTTAMPKALRDALDFELMHEGEPRGCERYRSPSGPPSGAGESSACTARLALLLCEEGGGAPSSAWQERLGGACRGHAEESLAQRAWELRRLASLRASAPEPFLEAAERLVADLSAPSSEGSAWLREFVARDLRGRLESIRSSRGARLRSTLLSIAERASLLSALSRMSHARDARASSGSIPVDGWHRVVVTRAESGTLSGFELVAELAAMPLTAALKEMAPNAPIRVSLWANSSPSQDAAQELWSTKSRHHAFLLLKKAGLAWELVLSNDEDRGGFLSLASSRARLYLWTLAGIVASLIAGIAYTVRSVVLEARQSRLKVDFVSSVSHDLRTPLTSIRMFTETLLMGRVKSREEERECLKVIAQETERLSRLTQRILDFSRMEAGRRAYDPRPGSLDDLVRQSLGACRPLIEEAHFEVELALAPDADAVVVDRDAAIEVLVNLITNAVKYSPGERFLRIASRRTAGGIELSVSDRGIGIARAEQARIFEKFYRVDCRRTAEVGGSGIGLSLVRHIARAHGGEVWVESEPGCGSTFTVRLPAPSQGERTSGLSQESRPAWRAS